MYVPFTICFFLVLDWHVVAHLPRKGGDVTVSRLVRYTVMAWDLGMHLVTSPRCLRNLTVSLISRLVTVYLLDHMSLLSCDALCLETASASLWGT